MELYDFNKETYDKVVELTKLKFYKEIKNTGIVFEEILKSQNLVTKSEFFILVCNDQESTHHVRFKESNVLLIQLREIAKRRLNILKQNEKELMKINDIESYGESNYFNVTNQTAISIETITGLLIFIDKKLT